VNDLDSISAIVIPRFQSAKSIDRASGINRNGQIDQEIVLAKAVSRLITERSKLLRINRIDGGRQKDRGIVGIEDTRWKSTLHLGPLAYHFVVWC
jgi:hypothetical protein